jgi:DNA-binding transcriptional regulator GbsR (MarR family)
MSKTKAVTKDVASLPARVVKTISPLLAVVVESVQTVENQKAIITCSISRAIAAVYQSLTTRKKMSGDRKTVYTVKYDAHKSIRTLFREMLLASLHTKLIAKAFTLTEARKLLATELANDVRAMLTRYTIALANFEVYFSQVTSLALGKKGDKGFQFFTAYATATQKTISQIWLAYPMTDATKLPAYDAQTGKAVPVKEKLPASEGGTEQKLLEAIDAALQRIPETETREGIEAILTHIETRASAAGYAFTYTLRKLRKVSKAS